MDGGWMDGGDVTTPRHIFLGLDWSQQHNSATFPETDLFMDPKGTSCSPGAEQTILTGK